MYINADCLLVLFVVLLSFASINNYRLLLILYYYLYIYRKVFWIYHNSFKMQFTSLLTTILIAMPLLVAAAPTAEPVPIPAADYDKCKTCLDECRRTPIQPPTQQKQHKRE